MYDRDVDLDLAVGAPGGPVRLARERRWSDCRRAPARFGSAPPDSVAQAVATAASVRSSVDRRSMPCASIQRAPAPAADVSDAQFATPRSSHSCPMLDADDLRLLVEQLERPLHRRRPQPADPEWYGLSRNQSRRSMDEITTATPPIIVRLDDRPLAAVGEEEHEDEDDSSGEEQDDPERRRDHTLGAVGAVGSGRSDGRIAGRATSRTPPALTPSPARSSASVRNIATPHGLMSSGPTPDVICGHSVLTTLRA